MKNIILILLLTFFITSCEERIQENDLPKCNYIIEIEYITGTVDTIIKELPKNSDLRIYTNRGSYILEYNPFINNTKDRDNHYYNIQSGVVRYEVLGYDFN